MSSTHAGLRRADRTAVAAASTTATAVLTHPALWVTALRQWRRTTVPGWWRRPPFLPLPSAGYVRFRALTQYGDGDHGLASDDVLNYLTWCRRHDGAR